MGLLTRWWPILTVAVATIWIFYIQVRTYENFLIGKPLDDTTLTQVE